MNDVGTKELLMRVEGMSCTGCEQRIGRVLDRLDGVRETAADHLTGQVRVVFDPVLVTPSTVAERIELAGYRVAGREEVSR